MVKIRVFVVAFLAMLIICVAACAETLLDDRMVIGQETNRFVDIPIVRPCYSYTHKVVAGLSFSDGKANCNGSVTPYSSYDSSVIVTLYKKNGTKWDYVTSWSGSAKDGLIAAAGGSVSVSHGTYKVVTIGNVANLEYPSASIERTY